MENIKQALIKLHGLDPEASDDTILAAVQGAKVLTDDVRNNIETGALSKLATFADFEKLENRFKKEVKNNLKGAAYEMREDEILTHYDVAHLKRGEDFNNMFELIDKIGEEKFGSGVKPDEKVKKLEADLREERKMVSTLKNEKEAEYTKGKTEGLNQSIGFAKEVGINSVSSSLVDAKQLATVKDFISYEFDKGYNIEVEDGKFNVLDKDGRPVIGEDGNGKSVGQVMLELAKEKTSLEFANNVPNGGRGGSEKASSKTESKKAEEIAKNTPDGESPFTMENYEAMEEKSE